MPGVRKRVGYLRTMRYHFAFLGLLIALLGHGQDAKRWAKARAQLDAGKAYGAIRTCDRMLAGKSPQLEFLVLRAEGRNRIGETDLALRDTRRAMASLQGELWKQAALQTGVAWAGKGRSDSARHWYEQALGAADESEVLYRLGLLDMIAGHLPTAKANFDRVLQLRPERAAAYRERGSCNARMGDTTAARADFDRALELAPRDPSMWNARGFELSARNGAWRAAIADYDQAIKLDPNFSFAFNNRGFAYWKLNNEDKAMRDISLASRKRRNNPFVDRNLGLIALDKKDTGAACLHFKRALELRFTEFYGAEVQDLVNTHCGSSAPPPQVPAIPKEAAPQRPSNAPARTNAP